MTKDSNTFEDFLGAGGPAANPSGFAHISCAMLMRVRFVYVGRRYVLNSH